MTEKEQIKPFLRLWNTALKGELPINRALLKIKGISWNLSNSICKVLGISKDKKTGLLSDEETKRIEALIKNPGSIPVWLLNHQRDLDTGKDEHLVESDLKLRYEMDIKRLKRIKCYRGVRHIAGQPVRGQRTRSHFRKGAAVGVKRPKKIGGKT